MGKLLSNKKGFGAVSLLVFATILVVIGVGGWLVYRQTKKEPSKTTNTGQQSQTNNSTTSSDPSEGGKYLVIKEWGVRAKNPSQVSLEYAIDTGSKSARFTSKELVDADSSPGCGISGPTNHGGGIISRYLPTDMVHLPDEDKPASEVAADLMANGQAVKVGDYYYIYVGEQGLCGPNTELQQQTETGVKALLKTLEVIR